MKDNAYQLLVELLLEREAGAFDSLDKPISLAIDIYSELIGITREELIDWIKVAHKLAYQNCDWMDNRCRIKCNRHYAELLSKQ